MTPKITRFRAYQLGCAGSSFSYFAEGHFTLIEARLNENNADSLAHEMRLCGVETINTLHITSWDADHCSASELPDLLVATRPVRIECPGYEPSKDQGRECREIIRAYQARQRMSNRPVRLEFITPEYINGLAPPEGAAFRNILYNPRSIDPYCANNNSTVEFFRRGSFNVLSLGDIESTTIGAGLRRCKYLGRETDVMILAHHGANNGFTTKKSLENIKPTLAICSSNYDNQYDHPTQEIRDLLYEQRIRLMTTKTGDVVVKSIGGHRGRFRAINLKAGSTDISSTYDFVSKKSRLLAHNADTVRQLYTPTPGYRKL